MQKINTKGFTLVELIVVITIVGILSTIGFVSYSSYLTGARDSNRISQMVKLSDSLQVYSATRSLPLPDNHVEITASGTIIAYQGELGTDVLETIDFTNGGTDPKDDSFYTYYLTKDRKSLQLMALMEEQSSVASLNSINPIKNLTLQTQAQYEDRFPKVYGEQLGVLTEIDTNNPAHTVITTGELDIISNGTLYVANISNTNSISGASGDIISIFLNQSKEAFLNNNIAQYDSSLVGYWDMETLEGGELKDFSSYGNNGILNGGISVGGVSGNVGKATHFDGDDDYITIPNSPSLNPTEEITIITLSNSNGPGINSCSGNSCFPRILGKQGVTSSEQYAFWWEYGGQDDGAFAYRLDTIDATNSVEKIDNTLFAQTDNRWNNLIFSYSSGEPKLYINGALEGKGTDVFFGDMVPSSSDLIIGNSNGLFLIRAFYGEIDEIRIYNRVLSLSEIKRIYNYY